jgi:hypothetical protein
MCEDFIPLTHPFFMARGLRSGKAVLYYIQAAIDRFSPVRLGLKSRTLNTGFVAEEATHFRALCFCHAN